MGRLALIRHAEIPKFPGCCFLRFRPMCFSTTIITQGAVRWRLILARMSSASALSFWTEADSRALSIRKRFIAFSAICQCVGEVDPGGNEVGLDFQDLAIFGHGVFELSLTKQGIPEIIAGVHEVGIEAEGLPILGDGLAELTACGQSVTKAGEGIHALGVDEEGLAALDDGIIEASPPGQGISQVVVNPRVFGLACQGQLELGDRCV